MLIAKAFVIDDARELCIAVFEASPRNSEKAIREECRRIALNRGYPIRIQWSNPSWGDTFISHRSDEVLVIRRDMRDAENRLELLSDRYKVSHGRKQKVSLRKQLKRLRGSIRRLRKKEHLLMNAEE